jgi:nuclear-control-of-ATPase protein 2
MEGVVQPYAWGSKTFLPELLGTEPTGEPQAQQSDQDAAGRHHRWKSAVTRSIALMDIVLQEVADPHVPVDDFDDAVAARTDQDRYYQILEESDYSALSLNPAMVAERLTTISDTHLSSYQAEFRARTKEHGKPSGIIRYWLPATVLLVSSLQGENGTVGLVN